MDLIARFFFMMKYSEAAPSDTFSASDALCFVKAYDISAFRPYTRAVSFPLSPKKIAAVSAAVADTVGIYRMHQSGFVCHSYNFLCSLFVDLF
jgi:hypothetical protein